MTSEIELPVTYSPSGYGITATDLLEWAYLWDEAKTKWWLSWFNYLGSTSAGSILFGGIDCQATSMKYDKLSFCRFNISEIPQWIIVGITSAIFLLVA